MGTWDCTSRVERARVYESELWIFMERKSIWKYRKRRRRHFPLNAIGPCVMKYMRINSVEIDAVAGIQKCRVSDSRRNVCSRQFVFVFLHGARLRAQHKAVCNWKWFIVYKTLCVACDVCTWGTKTTTNRVEFSLDKIKCLEISTACWQHRTKLKLMPR